MIAILQLIAFLVFAVIVVHLLDKIVDELGFITWMINGHPGYDDDSNEDCPIHGPKK